MGGKHSAPSITPQDRAILDLKLQRDKLKQYQIRIQTVLDREHEIARGQLAAGQKEAALRALRRRRYQENLLIKTDKQLESLEELVSTIEFSLIEVSVLHGLQQGNEVLKEIHKEMNVENVENLLQETSDAQRYQRELDEILGYSLTLEDEEVVQAELEQMQNDSVDLNRDVAFSLPVPPIAPIQDITKQDVDEHINERQKERTLLAA